MTHRNLIDGHWQEATATTGNVNPSDAGDVLGTYALADAEQARTAVEAAAAAAPGWARTTGAARAEILDRAGDELLRRRDELGDRLAREEGETLPEAVSEVVRAGQIAPALAYGNTVVFKPAEPVPGSAWALDEAPHRAGLPAGVLNLVMGRGREIGDVITGAPEVAAVSFTGATATCERVLRAAQTHRARVQSERGGKSPLVVADDADLDLTVDVALEGSFGSTGQRCTASSRLVVMDAVHAAFVERLTTATRALTVDDARKPGTGMGPVVDAAQLDQNLPHGAVAAGEGAGVRGGERLERCAEGFHLAPAPAVGTRLHDTVNREEVCGPPASVIRVADYDETVPVADDSGYGLTAGLVTTSLARAADSRRRSTAGMVMISVPTAGEGTAACEFSTTTKTSYVAGGPWG
ncbi:aldehyde dehydrogenase family protein [Streptomyces sp. NBC_00582]|uniref:aldehyde dehydrogenase family protein n=1 Tax=Streptomyces sp. NBC_00582 TaxID=2975783 RepID=UPI002E816C6E|nr:aldehyde dehydrogenase family protein [Streptomyces sp. NBC_00582]WUB67263.1 aldehyde dehydrogenase family protein [Streptomyces sp. NBC_00582]